MYSCCSFLVLNLALIIAFICFEIRHTHLGYEIEIDGAQIIGQDWEKVPFVGGVTSVYKLDECPEEYPDEMIFDIWLGLEDYCYC